MTMVVTMRMMMDDPFRLELIYHLFAKLSLTPGGLSLA
jgi:hypothetical protein